LSLKIEKIISDKNEKVKGLTARRDELYIFEGEKLVKDILNSGFRPGLLILTEKGEESFPELLSGGLDGWVVSDRVMKKISLLKSPPSAVAVFEDLPGRDSGLEGDVVFVLDSIQDPGNLGSLFRCAAAFGIPAIVLTGDCVRMTNPKFLRTAQNSVFHVPVRKYESLSLFLKDAAVLRLHVYISTSHSREHRVPIQQMKSPAAVVIGNEGGGVDEEIIRKFPVISLDQTTAVESLNAGISGCILMERLAEKFGLLAVSSRRD